MNLILNSNFANFTVPELARRLRLLKALAPLWSPIDLTSIAAQRQDHFARSLAMIRRRLERPNNRADFFGHMLKVPKNQISEEWLLSQASTFIIAGTETTTTALSRVTAYLLQSPEVLSYLAKEVRGAFDSAVDINGDIVAQKLPYLCAVMDETLRLFPPVAFGLPRISPGAVVDGEFIPPGTALSSHSYTIMRDERYFHSAESWRPERFLPSTHPLYDAVFEDDTKEAFKPFSLGSRACLGINLAYTALRVLLAHLVLSFDWEAVGGEKALDDWERSLRCFMFWKRPALYVRFKPLTLSGEDSRRGE
jgi:cytochrome P450